MNTRQMNKKAETRGQKADRASNMRLMLALLAGAGALSLTSGCAWRQTARRDDLVAPPVDMQQPQLALGEHVFMANCNQCHPGGAAGLGPALNNKKVLTLSRAIKFQVRHGLGAMPRFSKSRISDEQLDALVVYVQTLRDQSRSLAQR